MPLYVVPGFRRQMRVTGKQAGERNRVTEDRTPVIDLQRMERLFAPRSIAIVGASDDSGWSRSTYANLRAGAFPGEIYCVNPRRETVHGQRAYPSLGSLPETVDLAYVLVGTDAVMPV